jgi:flagellar protein FliS
VAQRPNQRALRGVGIAGKEVSSGTDTNPKQSIPQYFSVIRTANCVAEKGGILMTYGRMLTQYRKTDVETAGKLDLVIMCYENAIRFLKQAMGHYESNAFEEKARALQKVFDIISELKSALDIEKGQRIAINLNSIYDYLLRSLLEADIRRDLDAFKSAIRLLAELKEAWESIASRSKDEAPLNQRIAA